MNKTVTVLVIIGILFFAAVLVVKVVASLVVGNN